jgi:hypothetical protein
MRIKGGIYAELPLSPFGTPVEAFLIEPPGEVPDSLGLTPLGVKLIEIGGTWHVIDWVGSQHYPYVADFVQEVKALGLSRRLPKTLEFEKLTPASRIILVHSNAIMDGWEEVWERDTEDWTCPKDRLRANPDDHPEGQCIASWWHDIKAEDLGPGPEPSGAARTPAGDTPPYAAWPRLEEAGPRRPGIFGMFPLPQITVIHDPDDNTHVDAAAVAGNASLPVIIEEE